MSVYNGYLTGEARETAIFEARIDNEFHRLSTIFEMKNMQYEQMCRDAEFKVFAENGTYEDLEYLISEASEQKTTEQSGVLANLIALARSIVEAIKKAVKSIFGIGNKDDIVEIDSTTMTNYNFITSVKDRIIADINKIKSGTDAKEGGKDLVKLFGDTAIKTVIPGAVVVGAVKIKRGESDKMVQELDALSDKVNAVLISLDKKFKDFTQKIKQPKQNQAQTDSQQPNTQQGQQTQQPNQAQPNVQQPNTQQGQPAQQPKTQQNQPASQQASTQSQGKSQVNTGKDQNSQQQPAPATQQNQNQQRSGKKLNKKPSQPLTNDQKNTFLSHESAMFEDGEQSTQQTDTNVNNTNINDEKENISAMTVVLRIISNIINGIINSIKKVINKANDMINKNQNDQNPPANDQNPPVKETMSFKLNNVSFLLNIKTGDVVKVTNAKGEPMQFNESLCPPKIKNIIDQIKAGTFNASQYTTGTNVNASTEDDPFGNNDYMVTEHENGLIEVTFRDDETEISRATSIFGIDYTNELLQESNSDVYDDEIKELGELFKDL